MSHPRHSQDLTTVSADRVCATTPQIMLWFAMIGYRLLAACTFILYTISVEAKLHFRLKQ